MYVFVDFITSVKTVRPYPVIGVLVPWITKYSFVGHPISVSFELCRVCSVVVLRRSGVRFVAKEFVIVGLLRTLCGCTNMWRHIIRSVIPMRFSGNTLLCLSELKVQQFRTTFVLKRRWPVGLVKKGSDPSSKRMRARHFIYDLVEDTDVRKKKDLEVILTDLVAGVGNRGDKITMKRNAAYHKLLLPGLAVYASRENIEKLSHLKDEVDYKPKYSSPFVEKTMQILQNMNVIVLMNKEVPWTIEPWHVRISFRKAGIHVPEDAISLPEEPICGPNMEMENNFFMVTVTINNTENVPVKCIIHHWSTHVSNKLPPADEGDQPRMPVCPVTVSRTASKANPG